MPGNQDPATPWPSPYVLLAAIAARTTTLRLVLGAIVSPLRHPLVTAKDLGHVGPVERRPTRGVADGQLAPRRVRRAGRGLPPARGDPRRATRHLAPGVDDVAGRASTAATTTSTRSGSSRRPRARVVRHSGSGARPCTRRWRDVWRRTAPASTRSVVPRRRNCGCSTTRWPRTVDAVSEIEMVGGIRGRFADANGVASLDDALGGRARAVGVGLLDDLLQAVDVHRRA